MGTWKYTDDNEEGDAGKWEDGDVYKCNKCIGSKLD